MAEQLDLATAIVPPPRISYRVTSLLLDWDGQTIRVDLMGSDGVAIDVMYTGATAVTLMTTLNKVDLSVKSLQRRVLEKLVTDGKLAAGTVSGAPP